MPKFRTVRGSELNASYLVDAINVDKIVYNPYNQGVLDITKVWYDINPDIYLFLFDDEVDRVVGYINAMPVTDELFESIKAHQEHDVYIDTEQILSYDKPGVYNLFFVSIAVLPEYQSKTSAFTKLYDGFVQHLIWLSEKGIYFSRIVSEAVSDKGARICRLSGMKEISNKEDSIIYFIDIKEKSLSPLSSKAKDLSDLYNFILKGVQL